MHLVSRLTFPLVDFEIFAFYIFGYCFCLLNFAVVFQVNSSKYYNILPIPNFAIFLCCFLATI